MNMKRVILITDGRMHILTLTVSIIISVGGKNISDISIVTAQVITREIFFSELLRVKGPYVFI